MTDGLEALLDQVPVLAAPRSVADLPGGLTNRNLRVTTRTEGLRRQAQPERRRPPRHRPGRGARELPGRRGGRRRRARRRLPARPRDAGHHLPAGQGPDQRDHRDPGVIPRAADAIRRLQAGPRFVNDFDMFARQAGYLALVSEHGFALPDAYDGFAPQWERVRRALAVRPAATVPCNNDLFAGNFIDDGDAGLADRLRVLRQQRPRLRARQHRHGVRPDKEQTDELVASWAGERRPGVPGARRAPVAVLGVRLGLWGFIQAATSPIDYDFHGWGMERFEKAARGSPATASRPAGPGGPRWLR